MEVTHGFFYRRKTIDLYFPKPQDWTESYVNLPPLISVLISSKQATLNELNTIYGLEDALDMYEIVAVDSYNQLMANERANNAT